MGLPTLAVVVPVLNERERLPVLFRSLCADAEARPEELIVVDGGSRDDSPRIAEDLGAKVLASEPGRGLQLRRGAEQATSELLLFLHADTRLSPGVLTRQREAFSDPELLATGLAQRIDHPRGVYRWIERAADARVRRGLVYGDSGLCVRRSAYEQVGGFQELPLFEDLDLSRRLRRQGQVRLLEPPGLTISARRWEREGPLRCTARNWALTLAFWAGVAPERLVRYYRAEGQLSRSPFRAHRPARNRP